MHINFLKVYFLKIKQYYLFLTLKKIVIGSADISLSGWLLTDKGNLDITKRDDFLKYWQPNSRSAFLAEHVWEHLCVEESQKAIKNCFEFLHPNGRLRIAVPDGFHPNPEYIEYVRPGGIGPGSDDHKVLYNYGSLSELLENAGFQVYLLEYWDEQGQFNFNEWSSTDGHIFRSKRYDKRNQDGALNYTSLIIDAVKP